MPQCQQHTFDRAKKEKNGRREKDVREKRGGGLSLLQCLNDKIGGNLGMEASKFLLVLVSGGRCLVSAIWSRRGKVWFKIMRKAGEPWYGKLENCHRSISGLKQKNNFAARSEIVSFLDWDNMSIPAALYEGRGHFKHPLTSYELNMLTGYPSKMTRRSQGILLKDGVKLLAKNALQHMWILKLWFYLNDV